MSTTKFSRKTRIQPPPWPCKRSPPCMPEPPPTPQAKLIHLTLRWQHPHQIWPFLPAVNYYNTFSLWQTVPPTQYWSGSDQPDGIIGPYGYLRWEAAEEIYRLRLYYVRTLGNVLSMKAYDLDLPQQPPWTVGPFYTTDLSEKSKIVFFLRA